jgi:hypothetical protein
MHDVDGNILRMAVNCTNVSGQIGQKNSPTLEALWNGVKCELFSQVSSCTCTLLASDNFRLSNNRKVLKYPTKQIIITFRGQRVTDLTHDVL